MDAWEPGAFGNDSAREWLAELVESEGWGMIDEALGAVLAAGDETIELATAEEAVAAAEVVAWIEDHPGRDEPEGLVDWIEEQEFEDAEGRLPRARRAVDRVFNEPCELLEQWRESGEFDAWRRRLAELKERLGT